MNQEKKMSGMLFKHLDNDNKEARSQVNVLEEPHVHILISRKLAKMFGVDPQKLMPYPEMSKPKLARSFHLVMKLKQYYQHGI